MVERLNLSVLPASLVPYLNSQRPSYRDSSPTSEKYSELRGTSVPCLNKQQVAAREFQSSRDSQSHGISVQHLNHQRVTGILVPFPVNYRDLKKIPFPKQSVTRDFGPIPRAIRDFSPVRKSVSCRVFQSHAQIREVAGNFSSLLKPVSYRFQSHV